MDSYSASGVHSLSGGALTTFPVNLAQKIFSALGDARASSAPAGYAYGRSDMLHSRCVGNFIATVNGSI